MASLRSSLARLAPRFGVVPAITGLTMVLLLACASARAASDSEALPIAVIVGKNSEVTTISRDELRELYLRRQRLWPNGARVIPINLPTDHPARQRFSEIVLGRSPSDLVAYWNARYFDGVTPPTVLRSPSAVRAYVAAEPDAIAYLPLSDVDDTCRVLLVLHP